MNIEHEQLSDGIVLVRLDGRLDALTSNLAQVRLLSIIPQRNTSFIMDFAGVTFLSSLGIRTLILVARNTISAGGKLVIANPQHLIHETLRMAGLDSIIPVYPSVDEAVAGLQS